MPKRSRDYRETLLMDLQNPKEAASYLNAAFEDSEEMFLLALRDVAEARQMARIAEAAGIARESIYRMLTGKGNPTYTNLVGILRALGLKFAIEAEDQTPKPAFQQPWNVECVAGKLDQACTNTANEAKNKDRARLSASLLIQPEVTSTAQFSLSTALDARGSLQPEAAI